ncbi:unnamed protein product [Anisakis simplex]|uniref:CA domain-containing protein n=1 Tax=Anisakis simplex TaxID=6269 RepID=A0A0M3JAG2_ANISI|nr:unnamed protein product [Anisakis simplex]
MEALGNEVARDFSIIIAARSGQMSNYATLSVTLLDENDHPPKFLQSEYSVKILASSPIGTVAVHVQAHDPDNGQNGVIRYAIAAGTLQLFESNDYGYFTINRVSGEVSTVKALSAHEHSEALLIVRATDQAEYSRSDTCSVRIQTTIDEQWQPIFQK